MVEEGGERYGSPETKSRRYVNLQKMKMLPASQSRGVQMAWSKRRMRRRRKNAPGSAIPVLQEMLLGAERSGAFNRYMLPKRRLSCEMEREPVARDISTWRTGGRGIFNIITGILSPASEKGGVFDATAAGGVKVFRLAPIEKSCAVTHGGLGEVISELLKLTRKRSHRLRSSSFGGVCSPRLKKQPPRRCSLRRRRGGDVFHKKVLADDSIAESR